MNINLESIFCQTWFNVWPETLYWLNQQQNPSHTINKLVAVARQGKQPHLKDNEKIDEDEVSAFAEQLEISQEQVKTLQAELKAETYRAEAYREELEYIKQQSCDRLVSKLQDKLSTAQISPVELGVLAQSVMRRQQEKDGNAPIDRKNWFAVRCALEKFIAILSH